MVSRGSRGRHLGVTMYFWWIGSQLTRQTGCGGEKGTVQLQNKLPNHIWRVFRWIFASNLPAKVLLAGYSGSPPVKDAAATEKCQNLIIQAIPQKKDGQSAHPSIFFVLFIYTAYWSNDSS